MTTHVPAADSPRPAAAVPRVRGWLMALSIVAAAGIGALLGLAISGGQATPTPATATTPQVQQAVDAYLAAWNDYDGEAFLGRITDDFQFGWTGSEAGTAADVLPNLTSASAVDWHVEIVGEPIMYAEGPTGPWTVAAVAEISGSTAHYQHESMLVFVLVDQDGELKVASHWIGGPGSLD